VPQIAIELPGVGVQKVEVPAGFTGDLTLTINFIRGWASRKVSVSHRTWVRVGEAEEPTPPEPGGS